MLTRINRRINKTLSCKCNRFRYGLMLCLVFACGCGSSSENDDSRSYVVPPDYEKQITEATEAIQRNPQDEIAYYKRGLTRSLIGDCDGAIADFSYVINHFGINDAHIYYFRGSAYKKKYDFEAAIHDYDHADRLCPKNPDILIQRAVAWIGIADHERLTKGSINQKKYQHVIDDCNQILKMDPSSVIAHETRGNAYRGLREYDRALADYEKAMQLSPKNGFIYYNRGCMYLEMEKFDLALNDLNRAIELGCPLSGLYADRGRVWAEKGEYDKAIQDYSEAIAKTPELGEAYYNRAKAYRAIGKTAEADKDLEMAKKYGISEQGLVITPDEKPGNQEK